MAERDVQTVAEFARNAAEHARRLKASGEPMLLTVDGEPALVVQDADSYHRLRDDAERLRVLEGIRRGIEDMEAGRGRPLGEVFSEIRREIREGRAGA
jgi:PHD/YefM family antitoxin component YafN of YafNO toxin-antitoxin module